jgi:hypothetical protein
MGKGQRDEKRPSSGVCIFLGSYQNTNKKHRSPGEYLLMLKIGKKFKKYQ